MDTSVRKSFLIAECQSMQTMLTERLGTNHPWMNIDIVALTDVELESARRLMHELLYAPPPRS